MIVSSVIEWADVQTDGRTSVREVHTDDQGKQYTQDYMANVGDDLNANLAAHAQNLEQQIENMAARQAAQDG